MDARDLTRAVWRRLPVGLRRGLVHKLVTAIAPGRPEPEPGSLSDDAPRFVVGFLTSASGLGQAARLTIRGLEAAGKTVYGVDLSRYFFESADLVPFAFRDGAGHRGPGRVIFTVSANYMRYMFQRLGEPFLRGKAVTGYWVWELPRVPADWDPGIARVHDIATCSEFVAGAVRARAPNANIKIAPYPVALEDLPELPPRAAPISEADPFTIVYSMNAASGFVRKNPVALISAYRRAFGGRKDRRLRLLVSNIEHYAPGRALLAQAVGDDPTIEIEFGARDRAAYWNWFGAPDLYASLHRAEGFALPIAEAMCMGLPVLATNWSANAEFMSPTNSLPIRASLIPIDDPQMKYVSGSDVWAEPDVDHAAQELARVAEDGELRARLGARARADARARFSSLIL